MSEKKGNFITAFIKRMEKATDDKIKGKKKTKEKRKEDAAKKLAKGK